VVFGTVSVLTLVVLRFFGGETTTLEQPRSRRKNERGRRMLKRLDSIELFKSSVRIRWDERRAAPRP
jgi:hypothetical protein